MKPSGNASYKSTHPDQVLGMLIEQGYRFQEPRSPSEHARAIKGNSLIVLYQNGTVLLQGADTESARPLLEAFEPSDNYDVLPF